MGLLFCHQQNSQDLIDAAQSASINLTVVNGASLKELLKYDSILTVLSGCDAYTIRLQGFSDLRMTQDVVR